jgi:hypothetical protein
MEIEKRMYKIENDRSRVLTVHRRRLLRLANDELLHLLELQPSTMTPTVGSIQ